MSWYYAPSVLQDGATALHMAAQEGKADVVKLLTEAGAQLDIQRTVCYFCFHVYSPGKQ